MTNAREGERQQSRFPEQEDLYVDSLFDSIVNDVDNTTITSINTDTGLECNSKNSTLLLLFAR